MDPLLEVLSEGPQCVDPLRAIAGCEDLLPAGSQETPLASHAASGKSLSLACPDPLQKCGELEPKDPLASLLAARRKPGRPKKETASAKTSPKSAFERVRATLAEVLMRMVEKAARGLGFRVSGLGQPPPLSRQFT